MKVRLILESSGPQLQVDAESEAESLALEAAFGGCELRGEVRYSSRSDNSFYAGNRREARMQVRILSGS